MKGRRESLLPADWFARGELDIRRAEILNANNDPEGAAFHLQQATEKYLKGFLIGKGWKLERTHDLEDLLDNAVDFDAGFEEFRSLCQEITEYYIEERYPMMVSSGLTVDEINAKVIKAKEFIGRIRSHGK